jgi:hypothetical protein
MMWVIRGTSSRSGGDFAMVVEAGSRAAVEAWALKRGVPAVFIGQAEPGDVTEAKRTKQLWKYTPDSRYTCFGRPLFARHLACLMLAGIITAGFVYVRTSKGLSRRSSSQTVSRTSPGHGAVLPVAKPLCVESDAAGATARSSSFISFVS